MTPGERSTTRLRRKGRRLSLALVDDFSRAPMKTQVEAMLRRLDAEDDADCAEIAAEIRYLYYGWPIL